MKDSYIVIESWMITELKLKGNELIVYAVINGFTQDGEHWYYGTRSHLSEWCGSTKETVSNCLKSLLEKGLIERQETREHGYTKISYRCIKNFDTPYKNFSGGVEKIYTIDNKVDSKSNTKRINREYSIHIDDDRKEYQYPIQCLKVLNDVLGKSFKTIPKDMAENLIRLKYPIEDIKRMVEHKQTQWSSDSKMKKYLKPDTLFRVSNIERYMDEALNSGTDLSWIDEYED